MVASLFQPEFLWIAIHFISCMKSSVGFQVSDKGGCDPQWLCLKYTGDFKIVCTLEVFTIPAGTDKVAHIELKYIFGFSPIQVPDPWLHSIPVLVHPLAHQSPAFPHPVPPSPVLPQLSHPPMLASLDQPYLPLDAASMTSKVQYISDSCTGGLGL